MLSTLSGGRRGRSWSRRKAWGRYVVFVNGGDEFREAGEHATAESLGSDVTEETLNHVQPRAEVRGGMHDEARMHGQPL